MQIHKILLKTSAEGPGVRACIWVQGCSHGCKGCFARHLWDASEGRTMTAEAIISQLSKVMADIEGVTFLGGEPMDQADELWKVAEFVKESGKNVITFTGYVYEELRDKNSEGISRLLENTDLLADGPFVEELLSYDRPMLGSSNQRFIYLTNKIKPEVMEQYKNSFEIRVGPNGRVQVNGMGDLKSLNEYLKKIDGGYNEITNF